MKKIILLILGLILLSSLVSAELSIEVLVIGGGGAGGGHTTAGVTGGGGAGGYQFDASFTVTAQVYPITIGDGGTGVSGDRGNNGEDSVFDTITAIGGGGGGTNTAGTPDGKDGGSGGGSGNGGTAGSGSQGNDGGTTTSDAIGGGGGGAGAVGDGGTGIGGVGLQNDINGTNIYYAGGGGGSSDHDNPLGGAGGGGTGGMWNDNSGMTAGTTNTGGGGGGSIHQSSTLAGANGGSGIVIISYITADFGNNTGGTITIDGANTVHTFTEDGDFTVEPPSIIGNSSVENVIEIDQTNNTITIINETFQPIVTGIINLTNESRAYMTWTSNLLSLSSPLNATCRARINNDVLGTQIIRTFTTTNEFGLIYLTSTNFSVNGENNVTFECQSTVGGSFNVFNTQGVIHLMNTTTTNINFLSESYNENVNSLTFTNIKTITFNTTNAINGLFNTLIVDGNAIYDYDATGNISTFIQIESLNCSENIRFGVIGTLGSSGLYCGLENVTNNSQINIRLFARGNGNISGNIFIKEFKILEEQFNRTSLDGLTITNSSFHDLISLTINTTTDNEAVVVKGTIPTVSDSVDNNVVTYRLRLDSNDGTSYLRTLRTASQFGISIIHDLFNGLTIGTQNITLQASCSLGNCTIQGGELYLYSANESRFLERNFLVTVTDDWDGVTINNFSVTLENGNKFETESGSLFVTTFNALENLLIQSPEGGGYFNRTINNHDTTTNLSTSLFQTEIRFTTKELITLNNLIDINYTITGNVSDVFNLRVGLYNVTVVKEGYFNLTEQINVTPLQNDTLAIDGMFNLVLNLTVQNAITRVSIINFSGNTTNTAFGFTSLFNTTIGWEIIPMIQNLSYLVSLDIIPGFAVTGNNLTLTSDNTTGFDRINHTIFLFTNNSISFEIRNAADLTFVSQRVNITMAGILSTLNFNTSNGTLFVDNIPDDTYIVTFISENFDPTILFATIGNNNHLDITAFMFTDIVSKVFLVRNSLNNDFIPGVTLTFLQNINGSLVTVVQSVTDFSGRSTVLLDETILYTIIAVADGFNTFTGQVIPTQDEYTILLSAVGADPFVSIWDDISVTTAFRFEANGTFAESDIIINSILGSLQYYGMSATYDGIDFLVNQSGIPGGGVETLNITNIDTTIAQQVTIVYFFKSMDKDEVKWNTTYFLTDVIPTNVTLTSGLFDSIIALAPENVMRGIMGIIIIMILVMVIGVSTKDTTITTLAAMAGLGINWFYVLWPTELIVVSLIALTVILISDNMGGT